MPWFFEGSIGSLDAQIFFVIQQYDFRLHMSVYDRLVDHEIA